MSHENSSRRPRYLFVTGRLAEFALRRLLDELAPAWWFHGRGRRLADLRGRAHDTEMGCPASGNSRRESTA